MSANGQLKDSELAPIIGGGRLRTDAALAWNGFARYMKTTHGFDVGVNDSYRELGRPGDLSRNHWSQWMAWEKYQAGGNLAAQPGTSNHGLGLALDLAPATIDAVHKYGAGFGLDKKTSDAQSENWHFRWNGTIRPDLKARWCTPGQPQLKPGDRGPAVVQMKHRLQAWGAWPRLWPVDDKFAGRTPVAVRAFQKAHHLPVDGVVGAGTWKALLANPPKPASRPLVKPKPVAPKPKPAPKPVQVKPEPHPSGRTFFADIFEGDSFTAVEYAKSSRLVVLKATEGRTFVDGTHKQRVLEARKAGVRVFHYHFARPSNNNPATEALNFANQIKTVGLLPQERLILDWEDPKFEGKNGDQWVAVFVQELKRQGFNLRILYSGAWYLPGTLSHWPNDSAGTPLRYWHAAYGSNPEANVPGMAKASLWAVQFTDNSHGTPVHHLPGVSPGDVNYLI